MVISNNDLIKILEKLEDRYGSTCELCDLIPGVRDEGYNLRIYDGDVYFTESEAEACE